MDWKGLVAVVTGANSGIGFKITERLIEMDMIVVGLDKNINNIKGINANLYALELDLTKEIEVTRAFQWVEENHGRIDVLVNNAGIAGVSSLIDGNVSEWRRLLDVNVLAVAQCTVEAVRIMRKLEIPHGQIINITSNLATFVPSYGPFHFYSATKFAAKALTEGFRQEFREIEPPIRISTIEPGLVKTEIFKSTLGEQIHDAIYGKYPCIEPGDVASAVEYILKVPHRVNVNNISVKPLKSES